MLSFEDTQGTYLHVVGAETVAAVVSTGQEAQGFKPTCVIHFVGGQSIEVNGQAEEVAKQIATEKRKWSAR